MFVRDVQLMRAPEAATTGGSNLGTDVWAAACTLLMLVCDLPCMALVWRC